MSETWRVCCRSVSSKGRGSFGQAGKEIPSEETTAEVGNPRVADTPRVARGGDVACTRRWPGGRGAAASVDRDRGDEHPLRLGCHQDRIESWRPDHESDARRWRIVHHRLRRERDEELYQQ